MAKILSKYVCQSCGYESPRWTGKCPNCSAWNTFVEEVAHRSVAHKAVRASAIKGIPLAEVEMGDEQRVITSWSEFDRVLGGGIVHGSVVLLGGDPGVGK